MTVRKRAGRMEEYIFHCERRFYWPFYGTNKRPRYADLHTACFVIHRLPFARHPAATSPPPPLVSSRLLSSLRLPSSSSCSLLGFRRETGNRCPSKDGFSLLCRSNGDRFRKYLRSLSSPIVSSEAENALLSETHSV